MSYSPITRNNNIEPLTCMELLAKPLPLIAAFFHFSQARCLEPLATPSGRHWRQEPFCADRKTYTKPSAFVKYVIKYACTANLVTKFKFIIVP